MLKLNWNSIPGYKVLLKLYLEKISEINLNHPPFIFEEAGKHLLTNRYNLSLFTLQLISRTKFFKKYK